MGSSTKRIQYRFDAVGNRTLMTDPDGGRFTYAYDNMNRISQLVNPQGERTTYSYDANGRRTVTKLANGTRASFTYDAASRLTRLANLKSDGTTISSFDYQYDKAGNRTSVLEADGSRVSYSYDPTYQLTGEHRTGTTAYRNTFTYDPAGNRTLKNETGARTTYAYDAANQLTYAQDGTGRTTYTFDADGNQQLVVSPTGDRTTTTWDYENKTTLVQLPSGVRNTMAYDTEGLRMKLEESSGTKKFVWDDQNYLGETDASNDTQVVYTNEPQVYGNLVSQYRNTGGIWTPSYYHYDALGSTRQLTDSAESITDTYLYDAWGNVLTLSGTTINPFQWVGNVGYYFDPVTDSFYIRARIYQPLIARWTTVDPDSYAGTLQLYRYVRSRILILSDPSGQIATRNNFPKNSVDDTFSWGICTKPRGIGHPLGNYGTDFRPEGGEQVAYQSVLTFYEFECHVEHACYATEPGCDRECGPDQYIWIREKFIEAFRLPVLPDRHSVDLSRPDPFGLVEKYCPSSCDPCCDWWAKKTTIKVVEGGALRAGMNNQHSAWRSANDSSGFVKCADGSHQDIAGVEVSYPTSHVLIPGLDRPLAGNAKGFSYSAKLQKLQCWKDVFYEWRSNGYSGSK